MKRGFTYKDLSVIAGIAVALIVVFTLWIKPASQRPTQNLIHKAAFSINDIQTSLIDRTLAEVVR